MESIQKPDFAFFENGIYDDVLKEIMDAQSINPSRIFYVQPYSGNIINQLKSSIPTEAHPIPFYISTTNDLGHVV